MLVTASRRTDIPAFYSDWFMRRIEAGHFVAVNPYDRSQRVVTLAPEDVDAIVLLTKDPRPMLGHLSELDHRGYRYCFQVTLNSYPKIIEPAVPPVTARLDMIEHLAERIGHEKVVWRYDPIVISNLTPVDYHLENFAYLADRLSAHVSHVIVSLVTLYGKVLSRLKRPEIAERLEVIDIRDPAHEGELARLATGLSRTAAARGLAVTSCAEKIDLSDYGIAGGSCVDREHINRLFGLSLKTRRARQREACGCYHAVDMGFYDTCRFDCLYCYANRGTPYLFSRGHEPRAIGVKAKIGMVSPEFGSLPAPAT